VKRERSGRALTHAGVYEAHMRPAICRDVALRADVMTRSAFVVRPFESEAEAVPGRTTDLYQELCVHAQTSAVQSVLAVASHCPLGDHCTAVTKELWPWSTCRDFPVEVFQMRAV
jgi:hypothetical protein